MLKITVEIERMACRMCEAHINDAVRQNFSVKKVTSSHTKKQTVIIAENDISEQDLKKSDRRYGVRDHFRKQRAL